MGLGCFGSRPNTGNEAGRRHRGAVGVAAGPRPGAGRAAPCLL